MNINKKIYKDPFELSKFLSDEILEVSKKKINIALSGGSTPKLLFETLSTSYHNKISWNNINFYWSDERCVPPEHQDSNYGMTKKYLFNNILIPEQNIHRIEGEIAPKVAANNYEQKILNNIKKGSNDFPIFDWIILGLGTDGHTASIFPNSSLEIFPKNICAVAVNPQTNQQRITFTINLINNAKRVSFLVTGINKAKIIFEILSGKETAIKYPASLIKPPNGKLEWWLDEEAASLL